MSNIKVVETFVPHPGFSRAAGRTFPYAHRSLAQVDEKPVSGMTARTTIIDDPFAPKCRACKGRSPEWNVGTCLSCGNTGIASNAR